MKQSKMNTLKVQPKKKQIKQIVNELLHGEPDRMETIGFFVPDGTTRAALLVGSLYDKARQGDVRAFEAIMKYAGEDPDQKRKDAELKLKREVLKLQTEQFKINNEIEEPVKIMFDVPKNNE